MRFTKLIKYTLCIALSICYFKNSHAAICITTQPINKTCCTTGSIIFSLSVSGTNHSFQWQYKNGATWGNVIAGLPTGAAYLTPTNDTLTVNSISTTGNYLYRCLVSGGGCTDTTTTVTLSVVGVPVAPTATQSPLTTNVCAGTSLSLTNPTLGAGGIGCTFQYATSIDGGATYSSFTSTIPNITATGTNNKIQIRSICTGSGCNTSPATTYSWTVNPLPSAPTATQSPSNGNVCVGALLTLTNPILGNGGIGCNFEYATSINGGTTYSAFSSTLPTITAIGTDNRIQIRSTCSGTGCGNSTATTYTWNVSTLPVAPTATKSPNVTDVCTGQSLTLTGVVDNGGGSGTCTTEYSKNGGTYSSTLTPLIATVGTNTIAIRKNCSGNNCGTSSITTYTWNGVAQPTPQTINANYADGTTICIGTNVSATFTGGSGGIGTTDVYEYSTNSGTTWTNYLAGTNVAASLVGTGTLKIRTKRNSTGTGCNASSYNTNSYNVVAAPVAQTISATYTDGSTVCVGTNVSATFSGGSGGSGAINNIYESTIDGINWVTYTPNSFLTAYTTGTGVLGFRTKRTATGGGCTSSTYSTFMYNVVEAPSIILQPFNNTKCVNDTSTFTVAVNGGVSLSYQWQYFNGTTWNNVTSGTPSGAIYSNQTTATLQINGISNAGIYSYQCTVTSGGNNCTSPLISNTSNLTLNALPVPIISNNTSICAGANTLLVAGGGIGYVWTPTTGLNSPYISNPIATPSATTAYSVVITDANNCSTTSNSIVVTVNAAPTVSAGANTSICLGGSTTLQASGGTNYSWSPNIDLSNTSISNPISTATTNTTYTVTVTNNNGCSNTDNVLITVNPLPLANAGSDVSICSGDSTILNASGGLTYSWNPPTGLSSIDISNPTANPTVQTTYTVTVYDANGCNNTDSAIVSIYQPITPIINGNTTVCKNSFWETYTGNTNSNSYTWSVTGGNIMYGQNTNSIFVHWLSGSAGTVNLHETSNTTGCENSASLNVNMNNNLAPDTVEIKLKSNDILICTDSTFITYKWGYESKVTGTPIFTCNNTQYCHFTSFDPSNFYYWVIVGNGNGCETKSYYVTPNFTGVKITEPNNKIKIYPNPAVELIQIDLELNSANNDLKIEIFNMLGEMELTQKISDSKGTSSINISQFPIGVYQINLSNHNQLIKSQKQLIVR
jgi:hypothetical protein